MFPEVNKGQPASPRLQNQTKYRENKLCYICAAKVCCTNFCCTSLQHKLDVIIFNI